MATHDTYKKFILFFSFSKLYLNLGILPNNYGFLQQYSASERNLLFFREFIIGPFTFLFFEGQRLHFVPGFLSSVLS